MKSAGPSPPSWPASPATSCKWCARSGNGIPDLCPLQHQRRGFSFRARRSLHPGRFATGRLFRESLSFIRNARIETLPRNLPQNDRKERYAPRSDALHRRQCGKSSHGAGTGIPRIYAPAPRRFQVSVRRRPGQMIPKTENRHPKRTAHRCDTGRTFGIIRNRLQAVRLQ